MEKQEIEIIKDKDVVLAIIIKNEYVSEGTRFITPQDFPQQIASISRKKGEFIAAHIHNLVKREVSLTQETLIIKKGKVKINFYTKEQKYLDSRMLGSGDIILLASGGHGFEFLQDTQMVEVKQGPYAGQDDKVRFQGIEK